MMPAIYGSAIAAFVSHLTVDRKNPAESATAKLSGLRGELSTLKVLLTHTPEFRRQYYGERSLNALQAGAQVGLHEADDALEAAGLIVAAGDRDIIAAHCVTDGAGGTFLRRAIL